MTKKCEKCKKKKTKIKPKKKVIKKKKQSGKGIEGSAGGLFDPWFFKSEKETEKTT